MAKDCYDWSTERKINNLDEFKALIAKKKALVDKVSVQKSATAHQIEWLKGMLDANLVPLDDDGNIIVTQRDFAGFAAVYDSFTASNSGKVSGTPEIVQVMILPQGSDPIATLKAVIARSIKNDINSPDLADKFKYAKTFNQFAKVVDMNDNAFEVILKYNHWDDQMKNLVDDYIRVWLPRHTPSIKFKVKKR